MNRLYSEQDFEQLSPGRQEHLLKRLITDLAEFKSLKASTLWLSDPAQSGDTGQYGNFPEPLVQAGVGASFHVRNLTGIFNQKGKYWSIGMALHGSYVADHVAADKLANLHQHLPRMLELFRTRADRAGTFEYAGPTQQLAAGGAPPWS